LPVFLLHFAKIDMGPEGLAIMQGRFILPKVKIIGIGPIMKGKINEMSILRSS
jgi:hypothetical protein